MNAGNDHADQLLRSYVLRKYREDHEIIPGNKTYQGHIPGCDMASVLSFSSYDSTYGCETGCDYLRLEATIGCPHEEPVAYEYGQFGELWLLVDDLIGQERRGDP